MQVTFVGVLLIYLHGDSQVTPGISLERQENQCHTLETPGLNQAHQSRLIRNTSKPCHFSSTTGVEVDCIFSHDSSTPWAVRELSDRGILPKYC